MDWSHHLWCIQRIRPAKSITTVIIKVVIQHVRMLYARLDSSAPPCWMWVFNERFYSGWRFIHVLIMYLTNQSEDSDAFGGCRCWAVRALGDKQRGHLVHLGGLQTRVCEYTIEPRCHLWLETTAHHPWALAWWTLALRGTLSGRQLGLSVLLMLCLRQVTSERRRQRIPSVAKQQDW